MFAPKYFKKLATYEKNSGTLVLIYSSEVYFKKKLQKKIIFDSFSYFEDSSNMRDLEKGTCLELMKKLWEQKFSKIKKMENATIFLPSHK